MIRADVARAFAVNSAFLALSFAVAVVLARALGADGYGVYAFAWSLASLAALPATAGLPMLVLRETARGTAAGEHGTVRGAWRWAARAALVLSAAVVVVGAAVLLAVDRAPLGSQAATIAWALALVPLLAFAALRGAALRGLQRLVAGQLPESVVRPGVLLALIAGAGAVEVTLTPARAMALHVAAASVAFAAGAWLLARNTPPALRAAVPVMQGRSWLRATGPLAMVAGMQLVMQHTDIVMLGVFVPTAEVGVYRVGSQLAVLAAFGLAAVNMVVGPRFAALHAQDDRAAMQKLATSSARFVFALAAIVTLALAIAGPPLLEIVFGASFGAAYLPLLILLAGQCVNASTGSVGYLLNMTGHEGDAAKGMAVAAVANVVLNLLLIPRWGMHGAAVATAVSVVAWNVLLWRATRTRLGINSLAFRAP